MQPAITPSAAGSLDHRTPRRTRRRRRLATITGLAVLASLLFLGGWAVAEGYDQSTPEWDRRVEPLAQDTQHLRGLEFGRPIELVTLDHDEFVRFRDSSAQAQGPYVVEAGSDSLALQRALGLRQGSTPTTGGLLSAHEVVGYDPASNTIVVDGSVVGHGDFEPSVASAIVHHLTHALQHQHFAAIGSVDSDLSSARGSLAIFEGDARRVEEQFRRSTFSELGSTTVSPAADEYARATAAAPALLGEMRVLRLFETGGLRVLNRSFSDLEAATEESAFDPYHVRLEHPVDVPPLDAAGRHVNSHDALGQVNLHLMFAAVMEPFTATVATIGWSGDHLDVGRLDGQVCFAARIGTHGRRDADELEAAAARWANAGSPAASRTAVRRGSFVELNGCDPGPEADIAVVADGAEIVDYLTAWNGYMVLLERAEQVSAAQAKCMIPKIFSGISLEDLAETRTTERNVFSERGVVRRVSEARGACELV
jgi:hypothetical protein